MENTWGNDGNSQRLYFPGFQNHCRWWLQPWSLKTLAPWKKNNDKPREQIKKQRHYFAQVSPVVMNGWERWTIKKSESWRIDAFELCCRKSVLNIHWTDWFWSWSSDTLATWCKELTHLKRPWWWERLKMGERDNRGWDGWMTSPTQWTWIWVKS